MSDLDVRLSVQDFRLKFFGDLESEAQFGLIGLAIGLYDHTNYKVEADDL